MNLQLIFLRLVLRNSNLAIEREGERVCVCVCVCVCTSESQNGHKLPPKG